MDCAELPPQPPPPLPFSCTTIVDGLAGDDRLRSQRVAAAATVAELTMRSERRLRVTRGDTRCAVGSIALAAVAATAAGRESSFDDGASVMTGRCGGNGLRADGDRERDRSEAGEAERLLQFRSHRSGVIREP